MNGRSRAKIKIRASAKKAHPEPGDKSDLMETGTKELSQRQHALLLAAVQEFIASAEPVGSHQLAQRHTLGVRSAMVRNLMADLEDAGFHPIVRK